MIEKVLDGQGYVRLYKSYGDELDIVNAARASYAKESTELSEKDIQLIHFLVKHRHDSVLRHTSMTFEIKAPLMIARQWWKHHIGATALDGQNGWNESSRRYITSDNEYYVPKIWRGAPENSKQGSSGTIENKNLKFALEQSIQYNNDLYEKAINEGIAPEQARLFLNAYALMVNWQWTVSLDALLNFIALRDKPGAQSEIQEYAAVLKKILNTYYPHVMEAYNER